jgi:hypothetical protein
LDIEKSCVYLASTVTWELFSAMPIGSGFPKGIAIINRGFITLSFFRPLDTLWIAV